MNCYFKDVNVLADWLADSGSHNRAHVRPSQERRAKKALAQGGILLSYIMGIRCWAGVSKVTGKRLRIGDWDETFPKYFDVKPIHVLETPEKCFLVRESKMRTGHDGRGAYNHIWENGDRIHKQIKKVATMSARDAKAIAAADAAFEDFKRAWNEARDRSPFYAKLRTEESGGRCKVCGVTKDEWISRILNKGKPWLQALDMNRIRDKRFKMIETHHIVPVKYGGTAQLTNQTPVCPNCHDLLTRAGKRVHVR